MNRVYLLLGSNMGDREANLEKSCGFLIERLLPDYLEVDGLETAVNASGTYQTEPWGFVSETKFLNMALALLTEKEPGEVLEICKEIERELGREETAPEMLFDKAGKRVYSARPIDIDIIFYDRGSECGGRLLFEPVVMDTPELMIPHPLMHERMFVLDPLAEIAAEYFHPVLKKSVKSLRKELTNK